MNELTAILGVIGLFFVRIGIPLLLLIAFGTIVDRWQRHEHENEAHRHDHSNTLRHG